MAGSKQQNKASVIAVVIIVAVVAAGLVAWRMLGAVSSARSAVVHDGDGGELTLPLDVDARQTVTTSLGSNVVVVSDDSVHVEEADCPNNDCVKQGAISNVGEQIVCLPHKLWVEIVEDGASSDGNTASEDSGFDAESR